MAKHVASTLAIAAGLLAASSGALKAQAKMTIGISYQNLASPYVAALQQAAENACRPLASTASKPTRSTIPTRN
jgi:ABC-type sugar transport system substrate-binding protein